MQPLSSVQSESVLVRLPTRHLGASANITIAALDDDDDDHKGDGEDDDDSPYY